MTKEKILFAPIHYFYGKNYGSEMICAHDIFSRVVKLRPRSLAVSLTKLDQENDTSHLLYKYSIPKPFFPGLIDNFKLIFFYTRHGLSRIRKHHYSVIHHVFPFRIGRTFNPLFVLLGKNINKVIGPVMVSVNYPNEDLKKDSFFDLNENPISALTIRVLDPFFSVLCKMTLDKANTVVALNETAKRELVAYGVPSQKIKIIPIGIDTRKFTYIPLKEKDRKNFNLLTLGYLTRRKGTELTVKALQLVKREFPKVHLTVIGDGPQRRELENLSRELDLAKNVTFAGFVNYERLSREYQNSHLLVSMSRAESWGQVYIDAMACGLPVITSRNDGSNEIVINGKTGYLVDQEDYASLARKIINLIQHPKIMNRLGHNARLEVERKYDWDKVIIPEYLNIYDNLK